MGRIAICSGVSLAVDGFLVLGFTLIMLLWTPHPTHDANSNTGTTDKNLEAACAVQISSTPTSACTYYFPLIIHNDAPPVWTSRGLPDLTIIQVAISAQEPEIIYAVVDTAQTTTITALYRSTDNGLTWLPSSDDISGRIQSLFVHPMTPTMLLVGTLTGGGGVYRSDDSGQHWIAAGLDPFIRVVAAHPTIPTLWLAASYNPLIFGSAYAYRTENAGGNWETVIPTTTVVDSFAFDLEDLNRVYACALSGFLSSQDAGLTWSSGGFDRCSELVTHPYSHTVMYAISGNHVLTTKDRGLSWVQILIGEYSYRAFALDPTNPIVMYTATSDMLFKSTDTGASWQKIPLSPKMAFSYIEDLAVSPSGDLYLGTDQGVWSVTFR
jgi:photosystem II stability/assembly factor-like uncharacterized protein